MDALRCSLYPLRLGNTIRFHCDSFCQNPLFFMRKLNNNTALLQKKKQKTNKKQKQLRQIETSLFQFTTSFCA